MTQNDPNQSPPPPVDYGTPRSGGMFDPPPAPATETTPEQRTWGMLCHLAALSGFIGLPLGWILGPLIVWLIKKDTMPFVNDQGKESMNFGISVVIAAFVLSPTICLAGLGIILLIALGITAIIMVIIASVNANQGRWYRYPYAMRLIK